MSEPINPFKPDEKVFITIKGEEVEATVRLVWMDEVQVRVLAGALLWRTVRTVRAMPVSPTGTPPASSTEPNVSPVASGSASEPKDNVPSPAVETVAISPSAPVPDASPAQVTAEVPSPGEEGAVDNIPALTPKTEYVSCGVPEAEAERKRSKKRKGRR